MMTNKILESPPTLSLGLRRGADRGSSDHGWLQSRHTFSFSEYHDPAHMGFRSLRVVNDDRVAAGGGFPAHGHRDMEILSYVLEGSLEHKDSMGTGSVIRRGDMQRMSAGTGVRHSEFNASKSEGVHFLQMWIEPATLGIAPDYEQKTFAPSAGKLQLIASNDGRSGSVTVHADALIYVGAVAPMQALTFTLSPDRNLWLHVATGSMKVNGLLLQEGDAVWSQVPGGGTVSIEGTEDGEVLLFDLA
jgi:quercetin 2,3-dioxygenase